MEPRAQLTITLTADGQIQVGGSVPDKVTALGLLEMAKAAVLGLAQQAPAIVAATVVPRFNGRG